MSTDLDVRCPRCGTFTTTEEARDLLASPKVGDTQRATISGYLSENPRTRFTSPQVPRLLAMRPLSVAEKGDRLLAILAHTSPAPGRLIPVQCDSPSLLARTQAWDAVELAYLTQEYLGSDLGQLQVKNPTVLVNNVTQVKIAAPGWARLAEMRHKPSTSRVGFVAMWFHPGLETLRDDGLQAAIRDAGYEPQVINLHEHVNRIDDEIIAQIRQSRFIVADFTGSRGGVYFEAGFALGLGLPVIWTCKQATLDKKRLHFDVAHFNFLGWDDSADGCAVFKLKLQHRIESVIGPGPNKPPL
ncbi:MAG TPA: hypothetical protein VI504_10790 [Candidatus Eisenbacteria bacterium]|jgi:nucleoside 2-deoxyribosyltransferase